MADKSQILLKKLKQQVEVLERKAEASRAELHRALGKIHKLGKVLKKASKQQKVKKSVRRRNKRR